MRAKEGEGEGEGEHEHEPRALCRSGYSLDF